MKYLYPCNIKGTEENGEGFVVTFPDIAEAITGSFTFRDSLILAEDCLVVALEGYIVQSENCLPQPLWERAGIADRPACHRGPAGSVHRHAGTGISRADLAERLGVSSDAVDKLLSLDYSTPIAEVIKALKALGCELVAAD